MGFVGIHGIMNGRIFLENSLIGGTFRRKESDSLNVSYVKISYR